MTDKRAAEVLRKEARELSMRIGYGVEVSAHEIGADAIEMLEWLLGRNRDGNWPMSRQLWADYGGNVRDFRAFCEQQWRASRG